MGKINISGNVKSVKDWTYFSKKSLTNATTAQDVNFFDALDPILCNIPAPNQFPNKLYFKLMKIGFSVIPQNTGTIATATLQQAINSVLQNSRFVLSIVNESFLDIPLTKVIKNFFALGVTSGTMAQLNLGDDVLLNEPIIFDKGASFGAKMTVNTGLDCSTLISKIECRMSGFLIEAE